MNQINEFKFKKNIHCILVPYQTTYSLRIWLINHSPVDGKKPRDTGGSITLLSGGIKFKIT